MFLKNLDSVLPSLLSEEEEKMKALMALQDEQEEYIRKTQREKQELRQEMVTKSQALEEAQHQLEKVRASRRRMDQDIAVSATKSVSNPDLLLSV